MAVATGTHDRAGRFGRIRRQHRPDSGLRDSGPDAAGAGRGVRDGGLSPVMAAIGGDEEIVIPKGGGNGA